MTGTNFYLFKNLNMEKKKVFLFSDNADVSEICFVDISTIAEWIDNDEHEQGEDYEYTIKIVWMTEEEIENLPEANF